VTGDLRNKQPPLEVQAAFWLWTASFAVALFAVGLIYFGTTGNLSEAARLAALRRPLTFPGVDSQRLIRYLFFVGVLLAFVFRVRAGKNWARITLTILTSLYGLLGFPSLLMWISVGADTLFILYVVFSLLQATLIIAAIVFVFLPNANSYFRSTPRRSGKTDYDKSGA